MFVVVEAMLSLAVEYPEARSSQVMLYPFPARRQVTVAVEASAGGITAVRLFELNGRLVRHITVPAQLRLTLALEELAKGIYLFELKTARGERLRKLLVIH
jgi:hypothetical protein